MWLTLVAECTLKSTCAIATFPGRSRPLSRQIGVSPNSSSLNSTRRPSSKRAMSACSSPYLYLGWI